MTKLEWHDRIYTNSRARIARLVKDIREEIAKDARKDMDEQEFLKLFRGALRNVLEDITDWELG